MGLTVFLPTLGRLSGRATVQSFLNQELLEEDHLYVLGSGIERPEWVVEHPQVTFVGCPRSEFYGHDNVFKHLGLATSTHWAYIGDDDLFVPGVFGKVREWGMIHDGLLVGTFISPEGRQLGMHTQQGVPGKIALGFLQCVIPTWIKVPNFSAISDVDLMEWIVDEYGIGQVRWMPHPLTIARFPEMSKEVWDGFELGLGPWKGWQK